MNLARWGYKVSIKKDNVRFNTTKYLVEFIDYDLKAILWQVPDFTVELMRRVVSQAVDELLSYKIMFK